MIEELEAPRREVMIRELKPEVLIDCELLTNINPSTVLSEELFGPITIWNLTQGSQIPLIGRSLTPSSCSLFLISATGVVPVLVLKTEDLPLKTFNTLGNTEADAQDHTLILLETEFYMTTSSVQVFNWNRSIETLSEERDRCTPQIRPALHWQLSTEQPIVARVQNIIKSPDECHSFEIDFSEEGSIDRERFILCTPWETLVSIANFLEEDSSDLFIKLVQSSTEESQRLVVDFYQTSSESSLDHLVEEDLLFSLRFLKGLFLPSESANLNTTVLDDCSPLPRVCDQWAIPLAHLADDGESIYAPPVEVEPNGEQRRWLIRAERRMTLDSQCEEAELLSEIHKANPDRSDYLETATFTDWRSTE